MTFLASRTDFEVLGLEASSSRKLSCTRLEDSTVFWTVKILLESAKNLAENLRRPFLFSSSGNRLKKKLLKTFFACKKFWRPFFWECLKKNFENLGTDTDTWKGVIGKHGVIGLNENGRYLLQLCCSNGLRIMNTFFQNREVHKYSWYKPSMDQKSLIDFLHSFVRYVF